MYLCFFSFCFMELIMGGCLDIRITTPIFFFGYCEIFIRAITGMTCASCVQTVEKATRKMDGVIESNVNLATEKLTIQYDLTVFLYQILLKQFQIQDMKHMKIWKRQIQSMKKKTKTTEN